MKLCRLINLVSLSFLLLIVVATLFFLLSPYIKEGFINTHGRYQKCREKGYTKAFCLQSPYSRYPMFQCTCRNGLLGQRLPGIRRRCSCDYLDPSQNYLKDIYI